jgi:UDP-glucose 4-epimerase
MNLLITGGAGYIGSHVARQLSEQGDSVTVFDNLSTGSREALLYSEKLIHADLADEKALTEAVSNGRFDAVLHFAASIVVPESVSDPLKYYSNNTANTLKLIKACVDYGINKFVFSSTAAVYGMPSSGYADETAPPAPMNPYGASKLMSEQILRDTSLAHGLKYVVLRYFNVAGADPLLRMGQRTPNATHLIKVCCQAALGLRDRVEIFGVDYPTKDGTGVRDYIHVEDLASAHLAALSYLNDGGESSIFNVGYGEGSTVREVIEMVKKVSGVDFKVVESPRRPGDPAMLVARNEKIKNTGRWKPRYNNLEKIITDAWRWECKLNRIGG